MNITEFRGPHAFLSNFFRQPLVYKNEKYASSEHAFQAAKAKFPVGKEYIKNALTPAIAKKRGREVVCKFDWEQIKVQVMRDVLKAKFQEEFLRKQLLATGDRPLIEGNNWCDTFWGVCNCIRHKGIGQNTLGVLLMEIRNEINTASKNGITCS